jgi:hypothetical protein
MLPLRAGANLTSTLARSAVPKRVGCQFARRNYVAAASVGRSNLLFYAGLAGAGMGLQAYNMNDIHCDSMGNTYNC